MNKGIIALLALLITTALHGQQVARPDELIVDANGGGDFRDIQSAVDSAVPGQAIWIRHGNYEGAVLTESVRLIGEPPTTEQGPAVRLRSPIRVLDLPASSAVMVLDMQGCPDNPISCSVVEGEDCAGAIYIGGTFFADLTFLRCADVRIYAAAAGSLTAEDSTILVTRSGFFRVGGPAIALSGSRLLFDGETLVSAASGAIQGMQLVNASHVLLSSWSFVSGGGTLVSSLRAIGVDSSSSWVESSDFVHIRFVADSTVTVEAWSRERPNLRFVALAGSLPAHPLTQSFLDAASTQLLYLGNPNGGDARIVPRVLRELEMPEVPFAPLRYSPGNTPGKRFLGFPVMFQGGYIDSDWSIGTTLPAFVIF